jgi:signal transduction histidine kinase
MFIDVQKFIGGLKDRWFSIGPAVQLLIAVFAIIIPALAAFWLVDKLFVYLLARSYVEDVAEVFDLNKHLAKAISLVIFVAAVYLIAKTFSRTRASRRIGYLGIVGLLIGHSLLLWLGARIPPLYKCYVLTHDGEVIYRERPGIDPMTGRPCRPVTPELIYRLEEYRKGRRPQRIASDNPTFFDPRSSEPSVWYFREKDGTIELYDLMGFHPETGEELQPVTREIVDQWKTQNIDTIKTLHAPRPQRIDDPESFAFFDAVTGKPRVWYWRGPNGEYEFYDNQGYHPRTGEPLAVITKEAIDAWKRHADDARKKELDRRDREDREHQHALEQELERAEQEERNRQAAQEQERREETQAQESASRCDQLAANPTDRQKPPDLPGVHYDDLKTQAREAIEACSLAMKIYPAEQRFRYQYARALQVDEPYKAFNLHKQLIHESYLASYDNAGWILINTYKNIPKAVSLFKEGARRGDPDSMVSLADLIDKHYAFESNPQVASYTLLSRAAELGHPGAKLAIEQKQFEFQQLQQQQEFQQQQAQMMLQFFGAILQNVPR